MTLVVENYVREPLTLAVRITRDSSLVHETAYELPAFTPTENPDTTGAARIEAQVVDRAVRGTTYTVDASTGRHDGLAPDESGTYRVTCTGYTTVERHDGGRRRLGDRLTLSVYPRTGAGIVLDGPHCSGLW